MNINQYRTIKVLSNTWKEGMPVSGTLPSLFLSVQKPYFRSLASFTWLGTWLPASLRFSSHGLITRKQLKFVFLSFRLMYPGED